MHLGEIRFVRSSVKSAEYAGCRLHMVRMYHGRTLDGRDGRMWFSKCVAMNNHDVLQAHDVLLSYKEHLSVIYDRIIGTGKGIGRCITTVWTKNDKPVYLC